MIKLIIFDLDGVIVSTDEFHYQAWKALADKENIYFDQNINHRLRGVSRSRSLEIILEKATREYSQAEKEALMDYKNNIYVSLLASLSKESLLPGVEETLIKLKEHDRKLAIGSSSKNARRIINALEIESYFDYIVDGSQITNSKPHPEIFLKASEGLKIPASECAVVEDAESGIVSAKNAGMIAIGISFAKDYERADFGIEDIRELPEIIFSL